jgi:hypothetical protein
MSMSTSVTLQKTQDVTALPLAKPLDESVWQAWVLKGRAQDERSHAAGMRAAFATVFGAPGAALQSRGAGVQFFTPMAERLRDGKRRPIHRVTHLAQCEAGAQ